MKVTCEKSRIKRFAFCRTICISISFLSAFSRAMINFPAEMNRQRVSLLCALQQNNPSSCI